MNDIKSHRDKILSALLSGDRLSKLDMLTRFGVWNSGNVIFQLRREGYENIKTDMVTRRGKTFAEYFLEK
jgi:hypothetical protein